MLKPENAVAAIILVGQDFLLQLRDDKPDIFFPNHWGLFGGAIDSGETNIEALRREIKEELNIDFLLHRHLMEFNFNIELDRNIVFNRIFYELKIDRADLNRIRLAEGQRYGLFSKKNIFKLKLTPYDAYAIWCYINFDNKI